MANCKICGKPTTSHKMDDHFVCHTCWVSKNDEVERLRVQIEKGKKYENKVRNSGVDISNKLDEIGTKNELYTIMEEYQLMLNDSLLIDPKGEIYRKIFSKVSKTLFNLLFSFTQEEGWPFILDLMEVYDKDNRDVIDCTAIENVVGRMIILTIHNEGVESIPVEALEYLADFHDTHDLEWEESFACGWGFDHPEFYFTEILEKAIQADESIWASGILERAFYADQKKAAPILIDLLKRGDISYKDKLTLVQAITFFTDDDWDKPDLLPRYWDWKKAIDYGRFEWDEEVKISLKGVIEEELVDYIEKEQSKPMTPLDRIASLIPVNKIDFSKEWSFMDLQT